MDIILKEDVVKLGKAGDVVKVKDGYARNSLIPKGLALEVTEASLRAIDAQKRLKAKKEEAHKKEAQGVAEKLASASCTIAMPAGEEDKLFGAVTPADIAEALAQENIIIDKKNIVLEEEIHKLGIYHFKVKLHPEITQQVKIWVVKK